MRGLKLFECLSVDLTVLPEMRQVGDRVTKLAASMVIYAKLAASMAI